MPRLLSELRRRNVYRVGVAYIVVAWVIAQVLDLAFGAFGAPDWALRVLLVILVTGLPGALLVAWVFELTPDGIKRTDEVPAAESKTPHTGRRLNQLTLVALLLAVAFIAYDKLPADRKPDPEATLEVDKSVAVLPFVDMSQNSDQDWLVDGFTEELLNALARLPELKVTARTSSFEFRNTNISVGEIATRLGVAHVVEGSVRRIGEELRVTAQLIRARDGFHLWTDTYDRTTDDLLDVQLDVAENIAAALQVVMDDDKRGRMFATGTRDVAAFEAFARGRELFQQAHARSASPVSLEDANIYLGRAMELDPGYAQPALMHADRYAHQLLEPGAVIVGETSGLDPDNAFESLRRDFDMAARNAPDPASRVIAEINREYFSAHWGRLPGLLERLQELASAGDPLPGEGVWSAEVARFSGAYDLVETWIEQERQADPLNSSPMEDLLDLHLRRADYDRAAAVMGETRRRFGDFDRLRERAILLAFLRQDRAEVIRVIEQGFDRPADYVYYASLLAALKGNREEALRIAEPLHSLATWASYNLYLTYLVLGDRERMADLLRRIDASKIGPVIVTADSSATGCLPPGYEQMPNLLQRLQEARTDPLSFRVLTWDDVPR